MQLTEREKFLQKKIKEIGDIMLDLADYATPSKDWDKYENERKQYYAIMKERNKYRNELAISLFDKNKNREIENAEKNNKFENPKINGYGEATSRYITSSTYERAMKRQEKEVVQFLRY